MSQDTYESPRDTELEWAEGTIISQEPDESAFVCRVKLDDGMEVQAMIPRRDFTPERLPRAGDRVELIVNAGLCLVWRWEPVPTSPAPAPNSPQKYKK